MAVVNVFVVKDGNSVVKQIGRSVIMQPAVKPGNRSIKWYEDKRNNISRCHPGKGAPTPDPGGRQAVNIVIVRNILSVLAILLGEILPWSVTRAARARVNGFTYIRRLHNFEPQAPAIQGQ